MSRLLLTILISSLVWETPAFLAAQGPGFEEQSGLPSLPGDFSFAGQQSFRSTALSDENFDISTQRRSAGPRSGGELKPANTHAAWSATIEPAEIAAGKNGKIVLRAVVDAGYHIYAYRAGEDQVRNRTLIVATQKSKLQLAAPKTSAEVVSQDLGGILLEHYDGSVTWEIPIHVPADTPLGEQAIELQVGFNTCDATSCDPPAAIQFRGVVTVASKSDSAAAQMEAKEIDFKIVEQSKILANWIDGPEVSAGIVSRLAGEPLQAWMVLAALAGGFILNFMPCVLPVVGLKLMSFVNQAGNNHTRVIKLNLAFVSGILVVVLMLAAFNIFTKLAGQAVGWGEQFNSFPLQVTIVILLFAMSLSFLGVWEIPIPGFVTSYKAGELMQTGGTSGAFYKGIITTLLATPCSGPLLGAVFGETLKLSAWGSVIVFMSVGLGLGLPYLAMCLWPGSVRWLPKPGPWMETLKQFLAFPLLLSMVWFLNVIDSQYHIAVLVLLIVVWFGCWLIGRVPVYAEGHTRFRVGVTAIAICLVAGVGSFKYFGPTEHLLPWQIYSEAALETNRSQGRVVLVEFTARWCPTCQTNMRFAIERPMVAKLVERHQIATLLADWTDTSPTSESSSSIRRKVHELNSNSIPLLAIYPADPAAPPIVLRDVITQQQLLEAIEQAVRTDTAALGLSGKQR
jgi:suppressor for copper-sensitivity B